MGGYLVAVDGSPTSKDALQYALDVAADTRADVTAVNVVSPEQFFVGGDDPPESFAQADSDLLRTSVEDAEDHGQ